MQVPGIVQVKSVDTDGDLNSAGPALSREIPLKCRLGTTAVPFNKVQVRTHQDPRRVLFGNPCPGLNTWDYVVRFPPAKPDVFSLVT